MDKEDFGPIELMLFLGTPFLLSTGALAHHLWTERMGIRHRRRLSDGGNHDLKN